MNDRDENTPDDQRDASDAVSELRREERRLRLIVDGVRDHAISMLDPEGRIETINSPAERIKGYRLDEVRGQHFRIFFTEQDKAAGLPEHELEIARTRGKFEGEGWRRRKDGSLFYAAVSLSALRDDAGELVGFVKVTHDVTVQRELRERERAAREQLEVVLRGVTDGITLQDAATDRFLYANETAARTLGFASVAELLATPARAMTDRLAVFDAEGNPLPDGRLPSQRAVRGERVADEVVRLRGRAGSAAPHADGHDERWLIVSSTPIAAGPDAPRAQFVVNIFKDVTEHRRAEAALRESERRFRAVFDNALDAMLVADDDARLLEANQAACALLGRSREALLALRVGDLSPPADRRTTAAAWRRFLADGHQRGDVDLLRPDGSVRHAEYSAAANFLPGRHLSVLRDVTERRTTEATINFLAQASETLASSLDFHRTLASVARLAVPAIADWAAVDILGPERALQRLAVTHVDPAKVELAHELWRRWPPDPDAPHGVTHVVRTGQPEVIYAISDELIEASIQDPELLRVVRALGLHSSMCVPLVARGRVVGAISLVAAESGRRYSASDLLLAQDLARRAGIAIENALLYREAQDANRLKDEFLATVSHELRTPLTAVLGWATMVRARQGDPPYVSRGLEIIERNARAQAQLIEDLLDLSRVVTGKMRLEVRPVDLAEIVQSAVETNRPAASARGIALVPVLDPDAGPILGDAARLLQVVNNLLTNAVKFTPKGGRVQVYLRRADSSVEIVVRDTGQGIPPEFLPHVFERFRQADATTTRAQGGLGLGLAISRSLVEMHGGTIEAFSEGEGKGATFTVRIPIAPLRSTPVPGAAASSHPAVGGTTDLQCPAELAGVRILVVDDEADTRELLVSVFEHCNAAVTAAASAEEALAQLAHTRFDAIVSDIGLPREDGYSLIRKVRALSDEQGGRTPAVALTAYASTTDRTRALMAGYHAHVAKPVEADELIVTVATVLGRFSRP